MHPRQRAAHGKLAAALAIGRGRECQAVRSSPPGLGVMGEASEAAGIFDAGAAQAVPVHTHRQGDQMQELVLSVRNRMNGRVRRAAVRTD